METVADDAVITVKDTGIGVKEEDIPKLFEKFEQIDHELKDVQQGSGLGLLILKEIIEAHNGKIEVQSRPGEGTTFTIILPIH